MMSRSIGPGPLLTQWMNHEAQIYYSCNELLLYRDAQISNSHLKCIKQREKWRTTFNEARNGYRRTDRLTYSSFQREGVIAITLPDSFSWSQNQSFHGAGIPSLHQFPIMNSWWESIRVKERLLNQNSCDGIFVRSHRSCLRCMFYSKSSIACQWMKMYVSLFIRLHL